MLYRPLWAALPALGLATLVFGCSGSQGTPAPTLASLGEALFQDRSLSSPEGQSCSSCHDPNQAFVDPRQDKPTSEGVVPGRFGSRQTPSIAYLAFSPAFGFDATKGEFVGGQFWDGRAKTLEEQALGPLLNPTEMNNASKQDVVDRLRTGPLAEQFKTLFGESIFSNTDEAFASIGKAIAAFERTRSVSPFSSKYDAYLANQATLTAQEIRGLSLFEGTAKCSTCHPSRPSADGTPPLFTNFAYANIGVPKNPHNPAGPDFVDIGLKATTGRPEDKGKVKTPTLRNIARTAPYFHNGALATLEDAVRFYNARDKGGFAPPEVSENVNTTDMGDLGLTETQLADLVAFLKTLTDGYR